MTLNYIITSKYTLPQVGAYIAYMCSLLQIKSTQVFSRDILSIFVNWWVDDTCWVWMILFSNNNLPQYILCACEIHDFHIWMIIWLTQYNLIGDLKWKEAARRGLLTKLTHKLNVSLHDILTLH